MRVNSVFFCKQIISRLTEIHFTWGVQVFRQNKGKQKTLTGIDLSLFARRDSILKLGKLAVQICFVICRCLKLKVFFFVCPCSQVFRVFLSISSCWCISFPPSHTVRLAPHSEIAATSPRDAQYTKRLQIKSHVASRNTTNTNWSRFSSAPVPHPSYKFIITHQCS